MKKKIAAMALSAVLGLSVFGGVAQAKAAQAASVPGCSHTTLKYVEGSRTLVGYDPVSGGFHNKVYRKTYQCTTTGCTYEGYAYDYEYEDHTFFACNAQGHWFCHYCGFVDDTYPN